MPQVSVIVLTYNPNEAKLRQTLRAAAAQKDVTLEILISDDGSAKKDFSFLPGFMESIGISNYRLLEHPVNRGTVHSCLSAVEAATGEYVFLTSPGDLLFDPTVLRDFYRFAREQDAELCFGNAVFYTAEADTPKLTRQYGTPAQPHLYGPGVSRKQLCTCFFGGIWIIGASYFRSRRLALETLKQIAGVSVYMEDTPSTAFALAAGSKLCYYDRNTVWYEDGTGVSTGASEKWKHLLKKDVAAAFAKLKTQYPNDPYVDIAARNALVNNRKKRILGKLLHHPLTVFRFVLCKKAKPSPIRCTPEDLRRLDSMLKTD